MQLFRSQSMPIFLVGLIITTPLYATSTITIPTITVSAPKHGANKNIGNTVSFNHQQIKQQGSISITDFFNKQGLVQLQNHSSQENQTGISIHGFGANAGSNTLILIDGIPMTSFTAIGPNLNSILPDNILALDVLPGSYGARYGDQAVGGVINIITQVPTHNKTKLTVAGGNLAQRMATFFISRNVSQQVRFSLSGMGYHTNHQQQHNLQNNFNLNGQIDYAGERHHSKLSVYAYQTQIQLPPGAIWHGHVLPVNPLYDEQSNLIGTVANWQNKFFIDDNNQWLSNFSLQSAKTTGQLRFPFAYDQNSLLWQNQWNYKNWWLSGFDLQTQHYNANNPLVYNNVTADMSDFFGQLSIPIHQQLKFILGARYAQQWVTAEPQHNLILQSSSGVPVNDEGIVWSFHPHWQFYLRRDTNYRFAKANEIVWVTNNVYELQTQTGVSYQTGVKWQHNHDIFSFDVYQLDLNNEIAYDPTRTAEAPFGRMYNLPPTRRIGSDIAGNFALQKHFNLNLQTSIVNPYFTSGIYSGKQVPSVSPVNSSVSLTYQPQHKWYINVSEVYHSAFYAANDLSNQGDKMPGYFLTNLNWHYAWPRISADLMINNLFNTHYVSYATYSGPPNPQIEYFPADGISVLLNLSLDLD